MTQIKLVESESQADSASYNHLIFIVLSEAHNSAELLRYKHTFLVSRTAFRISELYSARNTVRIFINRLVPLTFGFYSISIQVYGNLTKYEYICENIYIYMHVYISISMYIYISIYVHHLNNSISCVEQVRILSKYDHKLAILRLSATGSGVVRRHVHIGKYIIHIYRYLAGAHKTIKSWNTARNTASFGCVQSLVGFVIGSQIDLRN